MGGIANQDVELAVVEEMNQAKIADPRSSERVRQVKATALEAHAAGLPVITTRANGFSEIIEPGRHGEILEHPGDPEAIARAIERWSPPDRRKLARAEIQQHAAEFSIEANLNATLHVIAAPQIAPSIPAGEA